MFTTTKSIRPLLGAALTLTAALCAADARACGPANLHQGCDADPAPGAMIDPTPAGRRPVIQIALLLDTSNSMDGLIGQAKTQLWRIVNQFNSARHNGQRPILQVALYHYGTPALGADTGYVRQLLPFTEDLDLVSEKLFALQTNGGEEYCGAVIESAVRGLSWSRCAPDYRAIFIAGNEPFNQGQTDYRRSCKHAMAHDIVVNTIFCGQTSEGIHTLWKDGADLTDGSYMSINQDAQVVHVPSPYDDELMKLNSKLNDTYLGYGSQGREGAARQLAQDANNAAASEAAMLSRVATKSSANYNAASWDLLDAVQQGLVKLEDVKTEDLPEEMRSLSAQQQQEFLAAKAKERTDVQARIQDLSAQRDAFVQEQMKQQAATAPAGNTLDEAVTHAVRDQAQKKNYTFENE